MTLSFQLSEKDHILYAQYMRWYNRKARTARYIIWSVLLLNTGALLYGLWVRMSFLLILPLLFSIALLATRIPGVWYGYWQRLHRRSMQQTPADHLYGERTFVFEEGCIQIRTAGAEGQVDWKMIQRAVRWRDFYALHLQPYTAYWIPRSAFQTNADETAFQELLRRHTPLELMG